MAGAHIWYQPHGASDVVTIDLGRALTSIEDYDVRDEAVAISLSGARTRIVFTATRNVDITAELIDGSDYNVIRQIEALIGHLHRGGLCSISENNRTLGAFLQYFPISTSAEIKYKTNLYDDYGNFVPLAGDILVLQGPSPAMLWEEVEVSNYGGSGTVELTEAPRLYWEQQPWILVRNKGFWPVLRLRSDAPPPGLISHGNRIAFSLSLPLEVPPNAFDKLAIAPHDPLVGVVSPGSIDDSIDIRINHGVGSKNPIGIATRSKWW